MSKKEQIIEKLKENGCRITKQRKMLIDIILENECSSCKEIFYKASQADEKIGGNCLQNDQCIRRNRSNQQKKYV